jgi:hypothetical protein
MARDYFRLHKICIDLLKTGLIWCLQVKEETLLQEWFVLSWWYGSANPGCTSSGQNYTTGIMIEIVMQLLPGSMFLEKLCE